MGIVGTLAAVAELASRRRGSRVRWKVDVSRRGITGSEGTYFVRLDSSEFPRQNFTPSGARQGMTTERREAEQIARRRAIDGIDPIDGWTDWPPQYDDYQADHLVRMPSLRDLKEGQ